MPPTRPRRPLHRLVLRLAPTVLAAGLALPAALPVQAQPAPAPVTGPEEAALLRALGDRAGLTALADDFVDRLLVDARIGRFFKEVKPKHLKQQIADQFCQLLGGGCAYDGDTMQKSHADLKIARADFLALVEVLQDAMDAQRVPFVVQNRLLARLAPMHRDIVTR